MSNDLKYWVAFSQLEKIGPVRFKKLYLNFPNMEAAWQASILELKQAGIEPNIIEEISIIKQRVNPEQEMNKLHEENIKVITIKDPLYPSQLKEIFNPPALLYIKGNPDNLVYKNNLAVVGTRKISNYGKQITPEIIKPLIQRGISIISGLALGVDALAHQLAVNNQGNTIAVLGTGIDNQSIYPSANRYLAKQIIENNGTILSEFPLGALPLKHHFPTRNRIIAGLSLGTLVIEAGEKSGAIITAYQSLEQNREVFAVPGSIYNPASIGTNNLIKKGAKPVTSFQDILDELNFKEITEHIINQKIRPENDNEKIILNFLSKEPIHIDQLIKKLNWTTAKTTSTISLMEMKGMIKNIGSQNYILIN